MKTWYFWTALLLPPMRCFGRRISLVLTSLALLAPAAQAQMPSVRYPIAASHDIRLFTAPDEASPHMEVPKSEASLWPLAETTSSEGSKWYLVKTKTGATGWIKGGQSEVAEKLATFFRSSSSGSFSSPPLEVHSGIDTQTTSNRIIVPIRMNGSAAFVPVMLNRTLQAHMLLDTGATYTLVARRIATGLRLYESSRTTLSTANGLISVPLAQLQSIKVGTAEALNLTVVIQDISMNAGIDGLLGLDFLSRFHTSIDSRQQLLILAPR
jgi:predicted aspartyl protease